MIIKTKKKLKKSIKEIINVTQFYKFLQWLNKKRVIILMYHGFFDESNQEGIEQYGNRWCGIKKFKKQIQYLRRNYNIIRLEQLIDHYTKDEKNPNKAVVITMDDGYKSNYSLAYPLLKQYQIPATIFIVTEFVQNQEYLWGDRLEYAIWKAEIDTLTITINNNTCTCKIKEEIDKIESVGEIRCKLELLSYNERKTIIEEIENKTKNRISETGNATTLQLPLQWSEIREMVKDGIVSVGSHSMRHPNLTTCTEEQLEEEIVESRKIIEREIGRECRLFCYPGGKYNNRVKHFVSKAGYTCATAIKGKTETRNRADRFELGRIGIGRTMNISDFIFKLCDIRNR